MKPSWDYLNGGYLAAHQVADIKPLASIWPAACTNNPCTSKYVQLCIYIYK